VEKTRFYLAKYSPEKLELKESNMPAYPYPWQVNWKGGSPKKVMMKNYWCYLTVVTIVIVAVGFAAYRHLPFFFDSKESETMIKS